MARSLPDNPNLLSLWTNGTNYNYTSVGNMRHKDELYKYAKHWESRDRFIAETFDYGVWLGDGNSY